MAGARSLSLVNESLPILQDGVHGPAFPHAASALVGRIAAYLGCELSNLVQAAVNPTPESSGLPWLILPSAIAGAQNPSGPACLPTSRPGKVVVHAPLPNTSKRLPLLRTTARGIKVARASESLHRIGNTDYWPPNGMSMQRLKISLARPALEGFRAVLSRSWRAETAYRKSVTPSHWIAGSPQGQCGVSSVWLAAVLAREYSIRSVFCWGSLIFDKQRAENITDHCWLEIDGGAGQKLILDLTGDQARGFNRQIVFDAKAELDREHIHYIALNRVNVDISRGKCSLANNPAWPRYQMLLGNTQHARTKGEPKEGTYDCLTVLRRCFESFSAVFGEDIEAHLSKLPRDSALMTPITDMATCVGQERERISAQRDGLETSADGFILELLHRFQRQISFTVA